MPYHFDWENKEAVKEIEVTKIQGWKDLTIEYTYKMFRPGQLDLYWHVKDVDHTWVVAHNDVDIVLEDPEHFFRRFLEDFKDELTEWSQKVLEGTGEPWMAEYILLFSDLLR